MEKAKAPRKTKTGLISFLVIAAIYSIKSLLVLPIIETLASDVMYAGSFLLIVLDCFAEIIEVCGVSVCYAWLLATLYNEGRAAKIFVSFGLLTAYKNMASTAVLWVLSGKISDAWLMEIVDALYFTVRALILLLVIFLITKRIISVYTDKRFVAMRVYKKTGEMPEVEVQYPFKRFYSRSNCLLRSAGVCAIITFAEKALDEVATDVLYIVLSGFPKEGITWLYMVLNYLSKIWFCIPVYICGRLSLCLMLRREK